MIAREAAAMLVEEDNLIPNINTGYDGEFGSPVNGYKKGQSVDIGVPPVPVTFTGSTFVGQDMTETKVNLKLDTQIGVGLTFTAVEKALELSQFRQRFLRPSMTSLRAQVKAILEQRMASGASQAVGTSGTIPADRKPWAAAQGALDRMLAPSDQRTILYSSDSNAKLQDTNATLFNPTKEVSSEFDTGLVGRYTGFNFYVDQSLPLQKAGAGAGYVVDGAAQTGSALKVKTGTGALVKGQIFTIAGIYAVHPILGTSNGQLRQFVVTADYAGGAGNVPIYPALDPTDSTHIGTIASAIVDAAALTFFDTETAGARQNLAFQKNAFVAAFAPLPVLASCEGYTATAGNVSVRVMTGGDFTNDKENTRIDVLFGSALVRPDHVVRVTE
jgi:hypothetical protein